jgi:RNA polymerase sigma factor (sigma-70 family)
LDVRLLDQLLSSTDDSEVDATDKKMLLAKYLDQKTFEEVGELFKITKQRVQQRISRAISRIQEKHRELIKGLE